MDTLALILALKALSGGGSGAIVVPELPTTDIKDGTIYVLSTDWSMHIHDTNGWHRVGGELYEWETTLTNGEVIYEGTIKLEA